VKAYATFPQHGYSCPSFICSFYTDAFGRPASSVAHPGVANNFDDESTQKHYTYYQWVCFVLFFQAAMCYFPKWLWECWENELMKTIVCGLNIGLRSEEEKNIKKGVLIEYLTKHMNVWKPITSQQMNPINSY